MILLDINWEENLRKAHAIKLSGFGHNWGNLGAEEWRRTAKQLKSSLNSRIKEINRLIKLGQAIYKE